jgi:hypothetical protein
MRIDVYVHASDDPVTALLTKVTEALQKMEQTMSALTDKIDALTDEVTQMKTVEQSAVTLLNGLTAIIADLKNGVSDPVVLAKIDAAISAISAAKNDLAAAVVADTPAAP